ncbi:MAG TPA: endolytic transglycosylase MltG [Marmoricola sp.]|nr:endolytic transglycosylase MltG [Marmoricola sp.]
MSNLESDDMHDPHDEAGYAEPQPGLADRVVGDRPLDDGPLDVRPGRRGHRGPHRQRRRGCLAAVVALVVLGAAAIFGGTWAVGQLRERLTGPPDYSGPGTGAVVFQVKQGETATAMAIGLAKLDVVKSAQAFTDAARTDPKSTSIQVGFYRMKKKMAAKDALAILENPSNLVQSLVTIPEGARVRDIVRDVVQHTDITKAAMTKALKDPGALGLPAYAHGNPEGYLFPATYSVVPDESATTLLRQMVAKSKAVTQQLGVAAGASKLGLDAEQVLTVASILEYEANRDQDYPKVARVIYNRLHRGMPLQLDSTVSYVSGRSGDVWTTNAERANDSAYNTYQHTGLPPGPIGSPGEATIKAALHPAQGPWLYFVPDFKNGSTHFSTTLAEHQKWVQQAQQFCQHSAKC